MIVQKLTEPFRWCVALLLAYGVLVDYERQGFPPDDSRPISDIGNYMKRHLHSAELHREAASSNVEVTATHPTHIQPHDYRALIHQASLDQQWPLTLSGSISDSKPSSL